MPCVKIVLKTKHKEYDMAHYDCLVIGAGFAGAVTAGELARRGNRRVLVLEKRDHVGGNAYDRLDASGILIHQYGPHIFHTSDRRVYDYLSQYTDWRDYRHEVVASVPAPGGRMELPVPFNLVSLETAFGPEKAGELVGKLIAAYGAEKRSRSWSCGPTPIRRSRLWQTMSTTMSLSATP